jgi:hypothetical protein
MGVRDHAVASMLDREASRSMTGQLGLAAGAEQLAGYLSRCSYAPGEPLDVHAASATRRECALDVYRVIGCDPAFQPRLEFKLRGPRVPLERCGCEPAQGGRLGPGDADVDGCGWPSQRVLDHVPDTWPSGLYVAQLTTAESPTGRLSARLGEDAMFVLRAARPGARSRILAQVGVATWNAYHIWQNRNLYIGDIGDPTGRESQSLRAHRVSFHRPGVGLAPTHNIPWWPPKARMYVPPFIEWLGQEETEVEWCTGIDLHEGRVPLEPYRLLVTLGHDEYWTRRQRDVVERFVAGGGNAAFFGGNLAYWQIRLTADATAMECYKRATDTFGEPLGRPLDPRYRDPIHHPGHDNADVTVESWTEPLRRPTTSMTGVSMQRGGGIHAGASWWWENFGGPERPAVGFTVTRPEHWIFRGLDLEQGAVFGAQQKLVGYECDGLDVEWVDGLPVPTGRGGVPEATEILAFADCRDWGETDYSGDVPVRRPGAHESIGAVGGVVALVAFRTPAGGTVVTAPVTDWTHALVPTVEYTRYRSLSPPVCPPCHVVRGITRNVLAELG